MRDSWKFKGATATYSTSDTFNAEASNGAASSNYSRNESAMVCLLLALTLVLMASMPGFAAVSCTNLTANAGVPSGGAVITASFTPAANALILVSAAADLNTGNGTGNTISGNIHAILCSSTTSRRAWPTPTCKSAVLRSPPAPRNCAAPGACTPGCQPTIDNIGATRPTPFSVGAF